MDGIPTPPESIWGFSPDNMGSGTWKEVLGPTSLPFPPNIIRPALANSATDDKKGYFLGGFTSLGTSPEVSLDYGVIRPAPGLLSFNFETLSLVNSSDGGYFASDYTNNPARNPGSMVQAPPFGVDGVLIIMGGFYPKGSFNNITIYDTHTGTWYSQKASGDIPVPRTRFCAVGVQENGNSTYEM